MPLNLETPESQEHPDVIACKRRILQLARDHTNRFHCGGGAEEAVRAAGLMPPAERRLQVVVEFSLSDGEHQETTLRFDESDLIDKTEEEQNTFVEEMLRADAMIYVGDQRIPVPIMVHDLNLLAPPEGVPMGHSLLYTSNEGRVAHIVPDHDTSGRGRRRGLAVALCSTESFGWQETSPRASGETCARCSERASRMLG